MMHFKWHDFWSCVLIFLKTIVAENKHSKIATNSFSHWGQNRPNDRPNFFYFVLQVNALVVQGMLPTSFQRTMLPLVDLYQCYSHNYPSLLVHQNTLIQLESHILMPPYATNSARRPMATKRTSVLPHQPQLVHTQNEWRGAKTWFALMSRDYTHQFCFAWVTVHCQRKICERYRFGWLHIKIIGDRDRHNRKPIGASLQFPL